MATLYSSSSSSSSYTLLSPLKNTPKHSTFLKRSLNSKRPHPVVHSLLSQQEADTSPALRTFWKWLSDEGVISPKCPVKPGVVPEGLGLVATKDIGRNEVVLEVPKKYWINPDTVAASEIGGVCNGLKPWISVALFLIREKKKGDESFWRYYFDILPEETDSTIYWSEEELSEIQGTQLLSTTLGVKEYVQTEFEKLEKEVILPHKELFPSPITIEDFQWAFGMCRSRAYSRLRGQSLVLVPLADLINHSQNITTEEYAWEIRGGGLFSTQTVFSLRNPVSVKAGGQVMVQYDINKSNADLALDYGFIESRPERNAYTLTLQISEADMFFGDKLDIAESNGLSENEYFDITLGNPIPPAMLPYLRLVALSGTDAFLLESIFRNSIWDHLQLPVSRSNELRICQVIREACNSVLASYPTTIEEDEKLLESGNLDSRLHIAVGVRVGEKKVLQQIEGIFKERELELDVLEYYQERRLKDLGLVGEQGDIIFWEPK